MNRPTQDRLKHVNTDGFDGRVGRWIDDAEDYMDHLEAENTQLRTERDRLREALNPFSHEVFTQMWGGNGMGDDSPVWGRNNALLTIGDFRRARAALTKREGGDDER